MVFLVAKLLLRFASLHVTFDLAKLNEYSTRIPIHPALEWFGGPLAQQCAYLCFILVRKTRVTARLFLASKTKYESASWQVAQSQSKFESRGWIERYDPSFAKWVGSSMHFAFMTLGCATFWQVCQNPRASWLGRCSAQWVRVHHNRYS